MKIAVLLLIVLTAGCRHAQKIPLHDRWRSYPNEWHHSLPDGGMADNEKFPHLYKVCWIGPFTGDTYCGRPVSLQIALDAIRLQANNVLNIHHFIQEVK